MKQLTIFSLFVLCSVVFGAPSPESDLSVRSPSDCKAVTVIISILSQHKASATLFCSSFISIPVKTVTSANVLLFCLPGILERVADSRRS